MVIKGRERIMRGKLENFSDLPIEKQIIFKKIKESINKFLETEVYIFGSYNHGYWDEESDYDVIVFTEKIMDIANHLREELGIKIDLLFGKNNLGYIQIP